MPIWILAACALAAVFGALIPTWGARRAQAQPMEVDLPAESLTLAAAWADPRRLPYLTDIDAEEFASGIHQRIWAAMLQAAGSALETVVDDDSAKPVADALAQKAPQWREATLMQLGQAERDLVAALPVAQDGVDLSGTDADEIAMDAAMRVHGAYEDRVVKNGAALVVASDTPDSTDMRFPPVVRLAAHVSAARRVVSAVFALAWTGALAWLMPMTGYHGPAYALAVAAWLVLGAGMLVISLVDHDTMYIDIGVWLATTSISWVLAVAAAWQGDSLDRAVPALAGVALTALLFEGVGRLYLWLRGRVGQGLGDTMIIVATVGIPIALTGQAALGYYSVMGALLAAIVGWVIARLRGQGGRDVPFAFGPWLALGPLLALPAAIWMPL